MPSHYKTTLRRRLKKDKARLRNVEAKRKIIVAAKPVLDLLESKFWPLPPANAGLIAGLASSNRKPA